MSALAALAASALFVVADAAENPKPSEASIAFANQGAIQDWIADGSKGIWIQDAHRTWYYAKFMGNCTGLQFTDSVGFRTEPSGALNRWSSIVVRDRGSCFFQSFERSAGPSIGKPALGSNG
ncbi:MAG: DUF6491 family protein [bacterium]